MSYYFQVLIYSAGLSVFLFIVPFVFIAIVCHEYAKAFTAKKIGCLEAEKINTNPFKLISVWGFILMSVTNYGWGKAQACNLNAVSKGKKVLYYFSGSIGNIIGAAVTLLLQATLLIIMLFEGIELSGVWDTVNMALNALVWIQISMALTQLLPVPGFSGYYILKTLFFEKTSSKFIEKLEANGKWIFTVIVLLGAMDYASEILTSLCCTGLMNAEEWFVDFVTGGLFTKAGW